MSADDPRSTLPEIAEDCLKLTTGLLVQEAGNVNIFQHAITKKAEIGRGQMARSIRLSSLQTDLFG